jgi:outer membrane protein OmpA-like peptidoglycan-associated protein
MRTVYVVVTILVGALAVAALPLSAQEVLSSESIEQELNKVVPRGIGVQVKQQVNLTIPFEINSARLRPEATAQLEQIRAALSQQSLLDVNVLVAGHTDASGSAQYNKQLSQRRARAVVAHLVAQGIDARRLQSEGYGEDRLLLPDEPLDPRNRRVELINLGRVNAQ